ncbi:MAG TPA: CBS domain-containing protein [Nitrososphaera sp.]|nr:CBS domain-containing protein [Nitrososphaera sp.]
MVRKPVREHTDAHMTTRVLVRDIMNSPVISASPDDTVYYIAKKMKNENIGSIIIMENEKPVGIVTDWDIVSKAIVNDTKPSHIKAKDVMKELYTIESEESITEAARLLRKHNIKRLGVVYKNRLVGIISSSDVIAVTPDLVEIVSEKASIIRGELGIARSASNVSGFCDQCGEWSDLLQYVEGTFICEVCRGESSGAEGA